MRIDFSIFKSISCASIMSTLIFFNSVVKDRVVFSPAAASAFRHFVNTFFQRRELTNGYLHTNLKIDFVNTRL